MAKNRIIYFACLAGAFLFYLFYYAWFSWYVLVLAVALPLLSLGLSLPAMIKVSLALSVPAATNRGSPVWLTVKNNREGFMPTPSIRFILSVTNEMTGDTETRHVTLSGGRTHKMALDARHCGANIAEVSRGKVYDYLGLFCLPIETPSEAEMLVMPIPAQISPMPNLARFQYKTYHPKNGGGFSEIHDMRPYRPGDSMRDIHWKLSTKLDDLIVREPQEPDKGLVVVSFDLGGSAEALDSTLDQLLWLSGWLTDREAVHDVRWLDPETLEPESATIADGEDLTALIDSLLRTKAETNIPTIAARSFPSADWRCHISPVQKGVNNEK